MENGMLAQRRLRDILELEERDSLSLCQIIQVSGLERDGPGLAIAFEVLTRRLLSR